MEIHIICHNIATIASALPSLFWSSLKGKQCSSWRWVYWFSGCLTPPSTSTRLFPSVEMNSNNSFPLSLPTSLVICKSESQTLESQSTLCSVVFRKELLPVTLLEVWTQGLLLPPSKPESLFPSAPTVVCDSYTHCSKNLAKRLSALGPHATSRCSTPSLRHILSMCAVLFCADAMLRHARTQKD